ncbi:MAG: hypothetical protein VX541_04635 [Candidatus Poribacteria bacterium]|nr:hypothetical protein [Candidatus Poribacteria bacterium]
MDVPAEETAAGADTDIAAFADEPAEVVETEPIAEEADVPVLVVVIVPVTLVEAEVAEAAPAVIPAEVPIPTELAEADPAVIPAVAPMPTAPTPDIFDPSQSSH